MDIVISSEAAMLSSLPSAGNVRLFINTDKNNVLYYVDSNGEFFIYSANDTMMEDSCSCEIATSWLKAINCALNSGLLTATDYGVIMNQGLNVTLTESTDPSTGTKTKSINIGPRTNSVAVSGITLSGTNAIAVSGTSQLSAAILPLNATDQSLIWISSDPAKATVSQTGLVTGVGVGATTIFAYSQSTPSVFGTRLINVS